MEQKRLGIPRHVPVAVQQWEGLIAVNYAARASGITRHMRIKEAKTKCPELVLVHVETIGGEPEPTDATVTGGQGPDGAPDASNSAPSGAAVNPEKSSNDHKNLRLTQKACLERYRRANADILQLLHRHAPSAVVEKASIDEVYMDVTALVDAELHAQDEGAGPAGQHHGAGGADAPAGLKAAETFVWGSIVMGPPLDPGSEFDRRLACGAGIACRLRGAILEELDFTSSAGIACNKLLAKIGSAMHKPNQQTLIPPRGVAGVMHTIPLGKVRNFGGKLGDQLAALGCTTAGDVQALPLDTLVKQFGKERAAWIAAAVRGESSDPVEERERPKSMLAAKSFTSTSDHAALQRWIGILAAELAPRMAADEAAFKRRPRTLVVHFRGGPGAGVERSRQTAMPRMPQGVPCADTIARAAWEVLTTRCAEDALPCCRLAISAAEFSELPVNSAAAITRFLVPKKAKKDEAEGIGRAGEEGSQEQGEGLGEKAQRASEFGSGKGEVADGAIGFEKGTLKRPREGSNGGVRPLDVFLKGQTGKRRHSSGNAGEKVVEPEAEEVDNDLSRADHGATAGMHGADGAEDELLKGIDVAEQRRLMKEAELYNTLAKLKGKGSNGGGSGGGAGKPKGKGPAQSAISSFFKKK